MYQNGAGPKLGRGVAADVPTTARSCYKYLVVRVASMLASSGRAMAPAVSGRRVSRSDVDAVGAFPVAGRRPSGGCGFFMTGLRRRGPGRRAASNRSGGGGNVSSRSCATTFSWRRRGGPGRGGGVPS